MLFTLVRLGEGVGWKSCRGALACLLCVPMCLTLLSAPPAGQEFNLIDERELAPLKELIDRMVR